MGMFDDLADKVKSGISASGEHAQLMNQVTDFIQSHGGGLSGLVERFRANGLGDAVNSWIGTGANMPVTSQQIQNVIGNSQVQAMAAKVGISPEMLATGLATVLPKVIDSMTPHGQVPGAAAPSATPAPPLS